MGIFDLARPIIFALDDQLVVLPPVLRLLLWAVLAALIGMAVYRWTSPQETLKKLKVRVRQDRRAMANFDGEADEMLPVLAASLGSSLKHLGLTFGAALLAGLPVLMLISPIAQRYGPDQPMAGSQVQVTAFGASDTVKQWFAGEQLMGFDSQSQVSTITWPATDQSLTLNADGNPIVSVPLPPGSAVIHKKLWWNALFANPAGYLADNAPVEALQFDLPPQQFLPLGPGWMRGWIFTFFVALILVSLILRVWWKIE